MSRKFDVGDKVKVKAAIANKPRIGYSKSWGREGRVVKSDYFAGKPAYRIEFTKGRRAWFHSNELVKQN